MVRRLAIVSCGVLCAVAVVLLATGAGARPARQAAAARSSNLAAQLGSFERVIAARGGLAPGHIHGVIPGRRALLAPRVAGGTCYASAGACSIVPCAVFTQADAITASSPSAVASATGSPSEAPAATNPSAVATVLSATAVSPVGTTRPVLRTAPLGAVLPTVRPVRPGLRSHSGACRTRPGTPPRSRWVSTTG